MATKLAPVTPGEILLEEFLKPLGISQYRLAKEVGVPSTRISEIVAGRRSITADTDLRVASRPFCNFPQVGASSTPYAAISWASLSSSAGSGRSAGPGAAGSSRRVMSR
ncbi:MAG: HigA family addiction module antitoxin [Trueperaceae bacterium]|nr:HigA family addiction module antitoxin [Trueperaceae bacterium]